MTGVKKAKPRTASAGKRPVASKPKPQPQAVDAQDIKSPSGFSQTAKKPDDLSLRKKELIDRVVTRSGVKKKDAKPVVEAMLAELGEMIAKEREMVLPPLGKLSVNRQKALPNGRVLILKVRQRDIDVISEVIEPVTE